MNNDTISILIGVAVMTVLCIIALVNTRLKEE